MGGRGIAGVDVEVLRCLGVKKRVRRGVEGGIRLLIGGVGWRWRVLFDILWNKNFETTRIEEVAWMYIERVSRKEKKKVMVWMVKVEGEL
jgi:hypothetical protein